MLLARTQTINFFFHCSFLWIYFVSFFSFLLRLLHLLGVRADPFVPTAILGETHFLFTTAVDYLYVRLR